MGRTRNRSLQTDFTLKANDAQWPQQAIMRTFFETVQVILEREKSRIRWKNELCTLFDREP